METKFEIIIRIKCKSSLTFTCCVGAGQPVAGRRRGSGRALVADRELARRHPLVKVVMEEDEALAVRVEILVIGRPQLAEPGEEMNKTQVFQWSLNTEQRLTSKLPCPPFPRSSPSSWARILLYTRSDLIVKTALATSVSK